MKTVRRQLASPPVLWAVLALEIAFIFLTLATLVSKVMATSWNLSWSMFFVGVIGSAWGAVIYQLLSCNADESENDGNT
ncbi:hypothetical protein EDF56_1011078 [Novosphingobium sp. PhB165]|uniref:hypothetical protein n=1 Tax=Novosphingobium sp. PhB165 TaxID=2485105 RepID=UPI0010495792|nr:hypothetical protein [Novosphingobium sp. PhB165]TCM22388.1 hypothetical protein EDF56_1011078 [Novosphingobium sp. PhB165]